MKAIHMYIVGNNRIQETSYGLSKFPSRVYLFSRNEVADADATRVLRTMYIYIFELRHVCVFAVSDAPYTLLHNFWNTF